MCIYNIFWKSLMVINIFAKISRAKTLGHISSIYIVYARGKSSLSNGFGALQSVSHLIRQGQSRELFSSAAITTTTTTIYFLWVFAPLQQ